MAPTPFRSRALVGAVTRFRDRLLAREAARDTAAIVAVTLANVVVGHLALSAATEHRAVSSLWPPAGIALFALTRYGSRLWPGVAAAAFILNTSNGISALGSAAIAAGDVLEALAGAWLVRRWWGNRVAPETLPDVVAITGLAGGVATLIGATIGVATLVITGATTMASVANLWLVWWTGDAVGVVVVAPLLFAWARRGEIRRTFRIHRVEFTMTHVALALITTAIFQWWAPLVFAVFPLAGWIALRQGMLGATLATLVVGVIAGWNTLAGYGPFTVSSPTGNLFALQLFLTLLGVMNLLFAALQEQARAGRDRLARLSRQLLTAHEDERRRVARDIHDELGQALTAAKIGLSAALQRTQLRGSLDSERHVRGAAATLDRAIDSVKRIILELRPGVLDNLGPVAAIEYATQQFTAQTHIPVRLQLPADLPALDTERSTTLYRVTQEALTNVARHAQATLVWVTLTTAPRVLTLRIADNGRGITDVHLRNLQSTGILGMRERAASCDGDLTVDRTSAGGTVVTLTLPRALVPPVAARTG